MNGLRLTNLLGSLACAFLLQACTTNRMTLVPSGPESVQTPLKVSAGLEERRDEFARAVAEAYGVVERFAAEHGWQSQAHAPFFDSVEIFATQESLWRRVLELDRLPQDTKMPTDGLAAGIEARVLVVVIPEEYTRLRPEYAQEQDSWMRLLAHEMVHRLHVAILRGNEDAMGPTWFFEGFAVVGAGQRIDSDVHYESTNQALAAVSDLHTRGSYKRYAAAVRYFMNKTTLAEMVSRAGQDGFEDWLRSLPPQ